MELEKYARWQLKRSASKGMGREPEDLVQEAITATLDDKRRWNNWLVPKTFIDR